MVNCEPAESLRRAIAVFGLIVAPIGAIWATVGFVIGDRSVAAVGLVAAVFGVWLLAERMMSRTRSASSIATRVALMTQVTAVLAVAAEPTIGLPLAMGSLVPVVMALAYVERRTLAGLMVASAVVGMFAAIAPSLLPWGSNSATPSTRRCRPAASSSSTSCSSYSSRTRASRSPTRRASSGTSSRCRTTLPRLWIRQEVGNLIARHMASAAGATDCALSTWDRVQDQLVTYGYHPSERRSALEKAYDLIDYPATKAVLLTQKPCVIQVDDPESDHREVAYLESIGQRSLVILPLIVRGETVGTVELTSPRPNAFDPRAIELARILAREAAINLDNARLHEEIRAQAYRDSLTGLANRARLQERIDHSLARLRGRSPEYAAAVLFIDLDHFKLINDRFGHGRGDRVLQVVADRIRACIRPGDTAARMGGDEFAILLEDVAGQEEASGRSPSACSRASAGRSSSAMPSRSSGQHRAHDERPRWRRPPRSCCGAPTSRCMPRRPRAVARSSCSAPTCSTSPPPAASWPGSSAAPRPVTS